MKNTGGAQQITVIGAGVSGTALALLAARLGAEVFVSEERSLSAETADRLRNQGVVWETGGHSGRAFAADLIVLSSGISPQAACVLEARRRDVPVIGELDFVFPHIRGRTVGVTGSNGKSTVTALIGHILRRARFRTAVGGNLGEAASLFAGETFDFVVLELSSFQLHWALNLNHEVAVVTNLAPDHIDWHGSYAAYVAAKAKILSLLPDSGWGIVQDRDFEALRVDRPERTVVLSWSPLPEHQTAGHIFMGENSAVLRLGCRGTEATEIPLFPYDAAGLVGKHNLENVAMSLAATRLLGIEVVASDALEGFRPLPHRCEVAGVLDGVTYIDDSKGTNVAASITAMTSIEGRKIVILGGQGKGEDYAPLAAAVAREAEAAVLLGAEKKNIADALRGAGFSALYAVENMEQAVAKARELAAPGMVVLLSPACTSWDMYASYKQRGEHFRSLVQRGGTLP